MFSSRKDEDVRVIMSCEC